MAKRLTLIISINRPRTRSNPPVIPVGMTTAKIPVANNHIELARKKTTRIEPEAYHRKTLVLVFIL